MAIPVFKFEKTTCRLKNEIFDSRTRYEIFVPCSILKWSESEIFFIFERGCAERVDSRYSAFMIFAYA